MCYFQPSRTMQQANSHSALDALSAIKDIAEILKPKATNRAELIEECKSGAFDGATVAYRTFPSFPITGLLDAELLDAFPSSLKFICNCGNCTRKISSCTSLNKTNPPGAGYDQINIPACTERSIRVSNTPTAVDDSTADITIWLLLGALRNFPVGLTALREGKWRGNPAPKLGHDPQGKVLGILGMGGIGRNVAVKARAFDMKIRYYNRTRLAPEVEAEAGNAEYVDFETLLRESDVLSLNLPLNVRFLFEIVG